MKNKNEPINKIIEYTGLTKDEIDKLVGLLVKHGK